MKKPRLGILAGLQNSWAWSQNPQIHSIAVLQSGGLCWRRHGAASDIRLCTPLLGYIYMAAGASPQPSSILQAQNPGRLC
ncbi:hypothetical protein FKM82_026456 [Ascaphus truei]